MWSRWKGRRARRQIEAPAPAPAPTQTPVERPAWADAATAQYDTVDPVRPYVKPYVIRECDG
ncbi:hypothetical protein ACNTMW_10180 [Planosporangium sp. 12N6]|uniref:hypothetical protein n=1 Tax=Planosporangium spinosum TaxID=3402278 RepID=UPI003CED543A